VDVFTRGSLDVPAARARGLNTNARRYIMNERFTLKISS